MASILFRIIIDDDVLASTAGIVFIVVIVDDNVFTTATSVRLAIFILIIRNYASRR